MKKLFALVCLLCAGFPLSLWASPPIPVCYQSAPGVCTVVSAANPLPITTSGGGGTSVAISATTTSTPIYPVMALGTTSTAITLYIDTASPWRYTPSTGTISFLNLGQTTLTGTLTANGNIVLGTGVLNSPNGGIQLQGTGLGFTQINTANSSGTNYTITAPAATGTIALTSGVLSSVPLGAGLTITQGIANASPLVSTSTGLYPQTFVNVYTGTHTVGATESAGLDVFNGTTTGTFNIPQGGTTGFLQGTSYNFLNASTSALTLSTTGGSYFYALGGTSTGTTAAVQGGGFAFCGVDSNGNYPCAGILNPAAGGSGTVNSGTSGQFAYYASSTNAVSGNSTYTTSTVPLLNAANTFTASSAVTPSTVSISTATFTPNFAASNNFNITLVHASCPCTLANPTNIVAGQAGVIVINQSATGSDLINTYGSDYIFTNATAPTLSTGASATDVFSYYVIDSTHIRISPVISTPLTALSGSTGTPTCGTGCSSITAGSTNSRGSMVSGSSVSAVTVNWSGTLSSTPFCTISDSNTSAVTDISSLSTSAMTVSMASALTSVTIYWVCPQ